MLRIGIAAIVVGCFMATPAVAADGASRKTAQEEKISEAMEKKLRAWRGQIEVLATSTNTQALVRAMAVLRKDYPECRSVLVEVFEKGNSRVRAFAVQVVGEKGEGEDDVAFVTKALDDRDVKVRRAAVLAVRRLGSGAFDALVGYLPGEDDPNNRKVAVKTLERWREKRAVPYLARLLQTETDVGVRKFIVVALERLTREKLGDDPDAWEEYAEAWLANERAKALLAPSGDGE